MADGMPTTFERWDPWVLKGILPQSVPGLPVVLSLFVLPIYIFWALSRQSWSRFSDRLHMLAAIVAIPITLKHVLFGVGPSLFAHPPMMLAGQVACCYLGTHDCTAVWPKMGNASCAELSAGLPPAAHHDDLTPAQFQTYMTRLPKAVVAHTALMAIPAIIFPLQTWASYRRAHLRVHRILGRIALGSLFLGLGVALLFFETTSDPRRGPGAPYYFAILFIGSFLCAAKGWIAILHRDVVEHRRWMMRLSGWMWGVFLGVRLYVILGAVMSFALGLGWKMSLVWSVSNWIAPWTGLAIAEWLVRKPAPLPEKKVL